MTSQSLTHLLWYKLGVDALWILLDYITHHPLILPMVAGGDESWSQTASRGHHVGFPSRTFFWTLDLWNVILSWQVYTHMDVEIERGGERQGGRGECK